MPRKPQSFPISISLAQVLEAREQRGAIGQFLNKNGTPKGVYIYGDVGRGKTMLMDLFFANLQVKAKQRIHFHAFMQDIHQRRQALREADVVAQIAMDMAKQAQVLCLDEMQISDIADAMIVGRLFQALLAQRHGHCHNLQPATRPALQGWPQPRPVCAGHQTHGKQASM